MRIMIVDDDPFVREVALAALSQLDSVIVRALDGGADAVAAAPSFLPDLVVLDLAMADMDGRETWTRLCATLPQRPRLVVMTADEEAEHRDEIKALRPDGFIAKPFAPLVMAAAVGRLIGTAPVAPADHSDRSAAVARRFQASLGDTAQAIEAALADFRRGAAPAREALLAAAHRLAGSATLFGYPAVGAAADRVEDVFRKVARGERVDAHTLASACEELARVCAEAAGKDGAG